MLVGGSTTSAWKKSEPALRAMAASYRIARVRPTSILRKVRLGLGLGRGLGRWLALSLALTTGPGLGLWLALSLALTTGDQAKNDYRFEDQGGLNERKDDSVF